MAFTENHDQIANSATGLRLHQWTNPGRLRALTALFCAGLAVSVAVAAGDPEGDTPPANKSNWWPGGWFGTTPTPKPEEKKPTAAKAEPADQGPSLAERAADMRAREEKAYWRRFNSCLRLQEIAAQSNDAALQRQAEQLNSQAFDIYMKRTSGTVGGAQFEPAANFIEGQTPKAKTAIGKPTFGGEDK